MHCHAQRLLCADQNNEPLDPGQRHLKSNWIHLPPIREAPKQDKTLQTYRIEVKSQVGGLPKRYERWPA
jgi:hypothetical protein